MPRLTAILVLPVIFCLTLGAAIDRAAEEKKVAARRSYWAFQAPQAAPVPNQADPWVRTAIDAFILRSLRAKDLRPSPPASRHTLLRRLYLDLTGLPPTPEQAREFLADPAPDAYEKLVEKLLASPHYGERWGLRWLDVVRYADSNGFELDAERPEAWRYRDYVIASFNSDKPYDRFLQEQIAGDELFPESRQALIATGFHRTGPIHIVGGNQDEEMNRQEVLTEMTTAVGASFLGMTVHCARCHDHKFDPILQSDYYRLQAVLAATEFTDVPMAPEAEWAAFLDNKRKFDDRMNPILNALKELEKPYREQAEAAKKAALSAEHRRALEKPEDRRTPDQKRLAKEAKAQIKPTWDEVVALIAGARKERRQDLRRRMHALELERPSPPARAYAVANKTMDPPVTHILKVGDHKKKLDPVEPGFPTVFPDLGIEMPVTAQGRRAALAKWLTHPDHPLTARVMVNRIWQFRMGHGLVDTPNDFGLLGAKRTHPELLDWLAVKFVESGWSVKAMDRMIVLSNVYRQSAGLNEAAAKLDPDNSLYWRATPRRLEGEHLRDAILTVTGSLNPKQGGAPIRVPIEQEIYEIIFTEAEPDNLWPVHPDAREHDRRSIYLLNKRTVRLPFLANFDQPDTMQSCAARPVSTHPLQALTLLNSNFLASQARRFAERLTTECGDDTGCAVKQAFERTLARDPDEQEKALSTQFLSGEGTLADFCLALLNRTEFVYIP